MNKPIENETAPASVPILSVRWNVVAICTIAAMVEGYDTQVIGYVAPAVSKIWNLAPGAFGPTFAVGLAGLMLGCMLIAPLSVRIGRKKIIVGATLAYGLLTLATATVTSLNMLFWLRFLTGLGIGGGLPNIAATAAEFSPPKWHTSIVSILFCGFGFGGFLGGVLAAQLMVAYGWQSVFVFGGGVSLLLVPVLAFGLPESGRRAKAAANTARAPIPVFDLFRDHRARTTAALWVMYFMGLMDLYLLASWLPTTISAQGISLGIAAIITGSMQIAGIVGALALAPIIDRFGPSPTLPIAYLVGALCVAAIGFTGTSVTLIALAVFGAGFGIVGGQNCTSGMTAKVYPSHMRSTGVGWALGIGRIGSILGPVIVGGLLARHVDVRTIFLLGALPALIAAIACFAMGRPDAFGKARSAVRSDKIGVF